MQILLTVWSRVLQDESSYEGRLKVLLVFACPDWKKCWNINLSPSPLLQMCRSWLEEQCYSKSIMMSFIFIGNCCQFETCGLYCLHWKHLGISDDVMLICQKLRGACFPRVNWCCHRTKMCVNRNWTIWRWRLSFESRTNFLLVLFLSQCIYSLLFIFGQLYCGVLQVNNTKKRMKMRRRRRKRLI